MQRRRSPDQENNEDRQATLTSLEQQMSVLVRRALRRLWSGEAAGGGLDQWAYAILVRLSDEGPMRVGEVARRFAIDKSNASRHLARLEEAGLVAARPDEQDARRSILGITPRGVEQLAAARAARMEPVRRVFAAWPARDLRDFARLLSRLNAELDQDNKPSRAPEGD